MLRQLLDKSELQLGLVEAGGPGALDRPIDWVHGSDLIDPTPFLADGHVILTTGTQFADARADDYRDYVRRLVRRGVQAIGFGTEVIRDGTPAELVDACRAEGLPLFEVPYRTPFIAVVRTVADSLDRDAHERDDWARNAQRALSLAALRNDPVEAVLGELHRQLGHAVFLIGGDGKARFPRAGASPAVEAEARRLLDRGQRASSSIALAEAAGDFGTGRVTLQTIGRSGELLGILGVLSGAAPAAASASAPGDAAATLDRAAQTVITGVVALLGLALEHDRNRARDRVLLRQALLVEALTGSPSTAQRIGAETSNPFPDGALLLAQVRAAASEVEAIVRESATSSAADLVFTRRLDDGLLLCGSTARVSGLAERARGRGAAVGMSRPFALDAVATAADEARLACARAHAGQTLIFDELVQGGMRAALDREDLRAVAQALLSPLREHDARFGTGLVEASRTWLEHNGQWEPAAAALGMHRHTLKARIRQVEQLTGTPLDTFAARTELWLALTSADRAADV